MGGFDEGEREERKEERAARKERQKRERRGNLFSFFLSSPLNFCIYFFLRESGFYISSFRSCLFFDVL